jgi:hypothetical protein
VYGSAIPYTRATRGSGRLDAAGRVVWDAPPRSEAPNALRARAYSSLDLLLDWAFAVRGARVASYVQLRNALGRRNDAIYIGYEDCAYGAAAASSCAPRDRFERGLPTLPVLGFRLVF